MKITRVLAGNPGMFTGKGTNTYVVASAGEVAVIDPGPALEDHREAVLEAIGDDKPVAVLVTHCHLDHVESANEIAATLGVLAMGPCPGPAFKPDRLLADGEVIQVGEVAIVAIDTPGHSAHHLCYRAGDALFTGDHIMGGSSVIVEFMSEYLASLEKARQLGVSMLYPGHGEIMEDPDKVIGWYLEHRLEREKQIVSAIESGAKSIGGIVEICYEEVDPIVFPMAARSVGAHLRKLEQEGFVTLPFGSSDWSSRVVFPAIASEPDA